jgi:hypothetical protein
MAETVVKITMKEIYDQNKKDHEKIIEHLQVTNGKVKLTRWMASTALAISLMVAGWILLI